MTFCEEGQGRSSSLCFVCFLASHFSLLSLPKPTFLCGFSMFYSLEGLSLYKDLKFGMSIGGLEFEEKRRGKPHVLNLLSGLWFKACHLSGNVALLMKGLTNQVKIMLEKYLVDLEISV